MPRMSNVTLIRALKHLDSDETDCRILGNDFNQLYGQALTIEAKMTKITTFDFNQLYGVAMRHSGSSTESSSK